jgi:hypothetical protein
VLCVAFCIVFVLRVVRYTLLVTHNFENERHVFGGNEANVTILNNTITNIDGGASDVRGVMNDIEQISIGAGMVLEGYYFNVLDNHIFLLSPPPFFFRLEIYIEQVTGGVGSYGYVSYAAGGNGGTGAGMTLVLSRSSLPLYSQINSPGIILGDIINVNSTILRNEILNVTGGGYVVPGSVKFAPGGDGMNFYLFYLFYVMLCYVMLCYVVKCYFILFYFIV